MRPSNAFREVKFGGQICVSHLSYSTRHPTGFELLCKIGSVVPNITRTESCLVNERWSLRNGAQWF